MASVSGEAMAQSEPFFLVVGVLSERNVLGKGM
jgi:hypothetical protein